MKNAISVLAGISHMISAGSDQAALPTSRM
jgi:hypothetical protein